MTRKNSSNTLDRRKVLQSLGVAIPLLGFGTFRGAARPLPDPTAENTVHRSELSAEAKDAFDTALSEGSYTQRRPLPEPLRTNLYVETDAKRYTLNFDYWEIHKNRIRPEKVRSADAVPDRDVLSFDRLPERASRAFERALENGRAELTGADKWLFGFDTQYVKRGEEYYRLNFVHMDLPQYSISPQLRGDV